MFCLNSVLKLLFLGLLFTLQGIAVLFELGNKTSFFKNLFVSFTRNCNF